ncbi:MAG: hypothetical protein JRI95_10430 [Deltaproteobacteria bacterium]|nr:hypothetical protein [Deltaproteobacteria bacterium]
MDKEEIIFWRDRYNTEEDLYNTGIEEELSSKFQQNKMITKDDLIQIVKWKFQGRLFGRQQRILRMIDSVEISFIEDVSRLAFKIKNDEKRLKLLSCIDGVGNSLSSVILSFKEPQNYGVFDIHAWRGLFGPEPKNLSTNKKHIIKFFNKLRDISSQTGLLCRDIEKAFFKRDLEKPKNKFT